MRSCCIIIFFAVAICSTFASPSAQNSLMLRGSWSGEVYTNTKVLIHNLIEDLKSSAKEALAAVATFESGLKDQAKIILEKSIEDVKKLKERFTFIIARILQKVLAGPLAVKACIQAQAGNAESVFNSTMSNALACTTDRIADFSAQIQTLKAMSDEALAFADSVLIDMQSCVTNSNGDVISAGLCLGALKLKAEATAAVFVTATALQIGRLNLSLITIKSAMEVCIGSQLFSAGLSIGNIILNVGTCAGGAVFSTILGDSEIPQNLPAPSDTLLI